MYPIIGLPYLNKEEIFTLFEIKEKEQDNYIFRHEEAVLNFYDDNVNGERVIQPEKLTIATASTTIKPVITRHGITFYDTKYLGPLAGLSEMEIYEREYAGGSYFAVKSGFLLYGVIMPYQIITEEFVECLGRVAHLCEEKFEEKKLKDGIQININRETGEIEDEES